MDGKYDSVAYKYIITRIFALTSFSPYSYTIFQIYNLMGIYELHWDLENSKCDSKLLNKYFAMKVLLASISLLIFN